MKPVEELIGVDGLTIAFSGNQGSRVVVEQVSLTIPRGETTALVGESGSGKTLLARSLVGLMPEGAAITHGTIRFKGRDITAGGMKAFQALRGRDISFVFQEPLSSLNPALKVGLQLTEGLRVHTGQSWDQCREEARRMLDRVCITDPAGVMGKYPHELSGGMRQRVMIATALILKPALLIADEPTTALDMIVQEEVLLLMGEVARELDAAVLLITHDLSAVASLADRVHVMNRGRIVEAGRVTDILSHAKDPYTRKLLAATPQPKADDDKDAGQSKAAPLLEVRDLSVAFPVKEAGFSLKRSSVTVLDTVSFNIAEGETLAIIGESGSGKTTLSRAIAGLQSPSSGKVLFRGQSVEELRKKSDRAMQFVFQDPFGSLDPRMTIGDIVSEGLLFTSGLTADDRKAKAAKALQDVELDPAFMDRLPHQLSGGQRQRASIARAIVMEPEFILADEPVSALDLTVQKQILDLLLALKQKIGFACLFVSHDLGVVEHFADRVGVLYRGQLVEIGSRANIFNRPHHPYTRQLLSATPRLALQDDSSYRLIRRTFADHQDNDKNGSGASEGAPGSRSYRQLAPDHFVVETI